MKTFKSLLSEKNAGNLEEGISIAKLKRLNLVSDDEFGKLRDADIADEKNGFFILAYLDGLLFTMVVANGL